MNIDLECIGLLSLILQDSPNDRQFILAILARSNTDPSKIFFDPTTEYPVFYRYANNKIPFYLMGKGVLTNIPRKGFSKRIFSSYYLSFAESIINSSKDQDVSKKLLSVSNFITLENSTGYRDAEAFLIFRDKALVFIRNYATTHKEEINSFLGTELSKDIYKSNETNKSEAQNKPRPSENQLVWSDLVLNLDRCVLRYKDNSPTEISIDTKIAKFLMILMNNQDKVIQYKDIAMDFKLICGINEVDNKNVARDVQSTKRDLLRFLEDKVGMTKKITSNMIIVKKNVGFKLSHSSSSH